MLRHLFFTRGLAFLGVLALISACGGGEAEQNVLSQKNKLGKSDSPTAGKVIIVEKTQKHQTVEIAVGDTLIVRLKGNPTTGYAWNCTEYSRSLPLQKVEYVPDQPILIGSGGHYDFSFVATMLSAGGPHHTGFRYFRAWEGENSAIETFDLDVTVVSKPKKVNCDASQVKCMTFMPVTCPAGKVPSVVNNCWGPCVEPTECDCPRGGATTPWCPEGFVCWGHTKKCGPYIW